MATLVPDDKLYCFDLMVKNFCLDNNGLAFYLGPVLPPTADGFPLRLVIIGLFESVLCSFKKIFIELISQLYRWDNFKNERTISR